MTSPMALAGIKVLDLSRVLAGPWASQMLGDLGADVIKIERPDGGDDTRGWGPPYPRDADGQNIQDAAYFCATNRNKKSVCLDMTTTEGQAAIRSLALECDVVIENFKVGGLKKYHLDYDSLIAINPRLVYCSITGFGQDGPYAERAGYDFLIQGMGGLMSLTGQPDGSPGGGPVKVGVALTDVMTGLYASIAILAALRHRDHSGEGQHIDLALLDVQVATLANQAMNYLTSGIAPTRMGNAHPNIVPYQAFESADGHFILTVGNDGQFAKFAKVVGHPEWALDAKFKTNAARVANREELISLITQATKTQPCRHWLEELEKVSVPAGPINSLDQVFADPQVIHRGLKVDVPHVSAGTVPGIANPIKLSKTPVTYRSGPPTLGQDSDEIITHLKNKTADHDQ